ncbi:hypothetical protein [Mesorhizobium sp. WSM3859]|uniref:hypothetical protein n=1 Tax=Mesorhizobium sp. WSM3859 TaxID=2029402 RepID=UPI000BAE8517|nr:hypothetical protein [Mesorhizobium sp. WSM3859]PBC09801.1 hypothetical protein CK230_13310 [Mesorhizobium sp. WSM3859]
MPDGETHDRFSSRQFSFVNNIFTYEIALQATIGEFFAKPARPKKPPAAEEIDRRRSIERACVVSVGSLKREAPYFQGARGVGLGVYAFGEARLAAWKLALLTG